MLISLPARAPTVLIHLLPRSPPLLTSPSTCFYAHSPALSLLESTSHAAAGEASEASWRRFSSAAKQSCRSGLPACHEGAAEWHGGTVVAGSQIARPQWTNTDAAASGALRLRYPRWARCDQANEVEGWSLLSASSTGENAKCECLPAENAV